MITDGVFVGMSCLDVVVHADLTPGPDQKISGHHQDVGAGGPAANAARTFAALGGRARLVTALGRHRVAALIRAELADAGVDVLDLTPDQADPPPVASVVVDRLGRRAIASVPPRPARLEVAGLEGALEGAGVVEVDGHLPEAAVVLARAAVSAALPVVVDAGRPKPVFDELFGLATHLVCAEVWAAADLRRFLGGRTRLVAVTAGDRPVRWWTATGSGRLAPPAVAAVSTLGAGDVLHGAFAFGIAQGRPDLEALREAVGTATDRCGTLSLGDWLARRREGS